MNKITAALFTIIFFKYSSVIGCNYGALDSVSEVFNSRLSSSMHIGKERLADSLHFIRNIDSVESSYKDHDFFRKEYDSAVKITENPYYRDFFEKCSSLYDESTDIREKASLHLLLESVRKKREVVEKMIKRQRKFAEDERAGIVRFSSADADRMFADFMTGSTYPTISAK